MRNLHKPDALRPITILPVLIALLLTACTDGHILYHAYRPIPESGWQPNDTLCFDFNIPDSLAVCRLTIGVRNKGDYPYQDLPLSICCTDSDNLVRFHETVRITLADKEGIWVGKGVGGLYQTGYTLRNALLQGSGRYTVKITSQLPDTLLQGLNDIGIEVRK